MAIAVYPAQVQGTASPGSVVRALRRCNADADADVVDSRRHDRRWHGQSVVSGGHRNCRR